MPLLQQIHFRIAFTFFYSLFGKYNHQGLLITQRCFHRCLGGKRREGQLCDQATFSGGLYLPDYSVMDNFIHVTE